MFGDFCKPINTVPYKTRSSGGAVGGVRWGAVKTFVQVPAFYILFGLNIS